MNMEMPVKTMYGEFYCIEGDLITNQLVKYSAHTRNELGMLKAFIKSGDNVIDVGAHIGTFSIAFATFNLGKGKIFAIEGNPENYDLLVKNINQNQLENTIIPKKMIVGAGNDIVTPKGNTGGSYFVKNADSSSTSSAMENWIKADLANLSIDLIKVDIEGFELSALNTFEDIIKTQLPIIYLEINKMALNRAGSSIEKIQDFLSSLGYRYFRNIGQRNSNNDRFTIAELESLKDGGDFFDLLAIHSDDERIPSNYLDFASYDALKNSLKHSSKRMDRVYHRLRNK